MDKCFFDPCGKGKAGKPLITAEPDRFRTIIKDDVNFIYSMVIGMQQSRNIKLSDVLQYELAPLPASMFTENREMRISKTKATLKKNLPVETPSRLTLL